MATTVYTVLVQGQGRMQFRADFAQASCPIEWFDGDGYDATPFQVADAHHRPTNAAGLLNAWRRGQGDAAWEPDEGEEPDVHALTAIDMDLLCDAIAVQAREAATGGSGWWFVRVWPDGSITKGREVSKCVPEAEYFRRGMPFPCTVWSSGPGQMSESEAEDYPAEEWCGESDRATALQRMDAAGYYPH